MKSWMLASSGFESTVEAGIDGAVGSVGDSCDDSLAMDVISVLFSELSMNSALPKCLCRFSVFATVRLLSPGYAASQSAGFRKPIRDRSMLNLEGPAWNPRNTEIGRHAKERDIMTQNNGMHPACDRRLTDFQWRNTNQDQWMSCPVPNDALS